MDEQEKPLSIKERIAQNKPEGELKTIPCPPARPICLRRPKGKKDASGKQLNRDASGNPLVMQLDCSGDVYQPTTELDLFSDILSGKEIKKQEYKSSDKDANCYSVELAWFVVIKDIKLYNEFFIETFTNAQQAVDAQKVGQSAGQQPADLPAEQPADLKADLPADLPAEQSEVDPVSAANELANLLPTAEEGEERKINLQQCLNNIIKYGIKKWIEEQGALPKFDEKDFDIANQDAVAINNYITQRLKLPAIILNTKLSEVNKELTKAIEEKRNEKIKELENKKMGIEKENNANAKEKLNTDEINNIIAFMLLRKLYKLVNSVGFGIFSSNLDNMDKNKEALQTFGSVPSPGSAPGPKKSDKPLEDMANDLKKINEVFELTLFIMNEKSGLSNFYGGVKIIEIFNIYHRTFDDLNDLFEGYIEMERALEERKALKVGGKSKAEEAAEAKYAEKKERDEKKRNAGLNPTKEMSKTKTTAALVLKTSATEVAKAGLNIALTQVASIAGTALLGAGFKAVMATIFTVAIAGIPFVNFIGIPILLGTIFYKVRQKQKAKKKEDKFMNKIKAREEIEKIKAEIAEAEPENEKLLAELNAKLNAVEEEFKKTSKLVSEVDIIQNIVDLGEMRKAFENNIKKREKGAKEFNDLFDKQERNKKDEERYTALRGKFKNLFKERDAFVAAIEEAENAVKEDTEKGIPDRQRKEIVEIRKSVDKLINLFSNLKEKIGTQAETIEEEIKKEGDTPFVPEESDNESNDLPNESKAGGQKKKTKRRTKVKKKTRRLQKKGKKKTRQRKIKRSTKKNTYNR